MTSGPTGRHLCVRIQLQQQMIASTDGHTSTFESHVATICHTGMTYVDEVI
jgi:hypothetical protein